MNNTSGRRIDRCPLNAPQPDTVEPPCDCIEKDEAGFWQQHCDCGNLGDFGDAIRWCNDANRLRNGGTHNEL